MNSLWTNILAYKDLPLFRGLNVLNQYIRPTVPVQEPIPTFQDQELLSTLFLEPPDDAVSPADSFHPIQMDVAETHERKPSCPCPTTIRHLVLSGGGETGFSFYSALRESNLAGFWKIEDIDSIYGVSAGAVFAVVVCLLPFFNWNIFDDFILKRPWQNVFSINLKSIIQSLKTQGILGISTFETIFLPLFNAIDMPIDITLAEFYEKTGIHLHIIATELPSLSAVDISHSTHPDWTVIQAVYCSSGLPMLFVPFVRDEKIYIDGGFVCNYPTQFCIDAGNNPDEIMGFVRIYNSITNLSAINSLTDYLYYLIGNMFGKLLEPHTDVKNQLSFSTKDPFANIIYTIYKASSEYAFRVSLQEEGVNVWSEFYAKTYPADSETKTDAFE
jgi:predicted acylesterase/phospholipase RssA